MTKQLNKTELRMVELIQADLFALNFINDCTKDSEQYYTRTNMTEFDNMHTVASKLCDNGYFSDARMVINFYESPYHYVKEANVVDLVDTISELCKTNTDHTEAQSDAITNWLEEYFFHMGLDLEEKIAEREDDLALYE